MREVLALLGDYYHSEEKLKETINFVLKDSFKITYSQIDDFAKLLLNNPYLVIISKENKLDPQKDNSLLWMDSYIENILSNYLSYGGKLLVLHSGLASYDVNGFYVKEITRGYFKYHPERKKVRYYGKHPEMELEVNFDLYDEHYFVEVFIDNTNVFLFSESEDGKSFAGWYHQYGKGKVVCLTPAHNEALEGDEYRKFLKDVILWM